MVAVQNEIAKQDTDENKTAWSLKISLLIVRRAHNGVLDNKSRRPLHAPAKTKLF